MFKTLDINQIRNLFSQDSYVTPDNTRRYKMDRIFLNSRWFFYFVFAGTVFESTHMAKKGIYTDDEWVKSSYRILVDVERCGGRFHLTGLENLIKSNEPAIIVSNHMSTLETLMFPCIIGSHRKLTFVVKDSLVKGPVFGPIMRSRDPIVVSRSNAREDFKIVLTKGEELIRKGISLVIFPQSTRITTFDPEKFNSLGIKLAQKTGATVIPAAIKTDFWGDSKIIKGFGPIHREKTIFMEFGEPMKIEGTGKTEHKQIIDFISSRLIQWGSPVINR